MQGSAGRRLGTPGRGCRVGVVVSCRVDIHMIALPYPA